jgi:hypothetical protein
MRYSVCKRDYDIVADCIAAATIDIKNCNLITAACNKRLRYTVVEYKNTPTLRIEQIVTDAIKIYTIRKCL